MKESKQDSISILLLPKESHPLKRVRLTELFMKEFCGRGNRIEWVLMSGKDTPEKTIADGNNTIHLVKKKINNEIISSIISPISRIRKLKHSKRILKENDIDLILANDGIIEGYIALYLSRRTGKKFAFYLSSLFVDMEMNGFKSERSVKNLIKWIKEMVKVPFRNHLIRKADIFHPISREMGSYFSRSRKEGPVMPLPLCPSDVFFQCGSGSKVDMDDSINMIYVGQITPVRRIELLFDVMHNMKTEVDRNIKLTLLGRIYSKGYRKKLERRIEKLDLKGNIDMISEIPISQVPRIIRGSNIGLCILPPTTSYRISSPTKVVEYLSLGIPVVGNNEISDQKNVIERSGGGYSPKYSMNEIKGSIIRISTDDEKARTMGSNGREWLLKNRNYEQLSRELFEFYVHNLKQQQK